MALAYATTAPHEVTAHMEDPTLFQIKAPSDFVEGHDHGGRTAELGQYFTPLWAAHALYERFFGHLTAGSLVIEPSCGAGAWLHAVPDDVEAIGYEIDPVVAAIAAADTGREIRVGDFTTMPIDGEPAALVGNPPFGAEPISRFIRRSYDWMTPASEAGFILPTHSVSFARTTLEVMRGLEVETFVLPRDLYPRLSFPLMFAKLKKSKVTRLVGFLLFDEAVAIRGVRAEYRRIVAAGRRPAWREVLRLALEACGGEATLERIYDIIEDVRPTPNKWWRDTIRREAGTHFERVSEGVFRLPRAA